METFEDWLKLQEVLVDKQTATPSYLAFDKRMFSSLI
jgi:hypothetical protein